MNKAEDMIVQLECGTERGTAFYVAPNTFLTVTHCIQEHIQGAQIILKIRGIDGKINECLATPVFSMTDYVKPVVLIKTDSPVTFATNSFPLIKDINPCVSVSIFGYPIADRNGMWIGGSVARTPSQVVDHDWDIGISPEKTRLKDFKGFSGSPLFHNDDIVGIVGNQSNIDHEAVYIEAISMSKIESLLKDAGIMVRHYDQPDSLNATETSVGGESVETLQHINRLLVAENRALKKDQNSIISKQYDEIITAQMNGDSTDGVYKLLELLDTEQVKQNNDFAGMYLQAAIWIMSDDLGKADGYVCTAKSMDPHIDTMQYDCLRSVQCHEYDEAEKQIGNITDTKALNMFLNIQNKRNKGAMIREYMEHCTIPLDTGSYYTLAFCYLQACEFALAKACTEHLLKLYPQSAPFWYLDGLIRYWEALPKEDKLSPSEHLPVLLRTEVRLTYEQIEMQNKAQQSFELSYQYASHYNHDEIRLNAMIGVLLCSWVCGNHSKSHEAYSALIAIDSVNPIAMVYAFITRSTLPDGIEKMLREAAHCSTNAPAYAETYIRFLIKEEKYDAALSELKMLEEKIKAHSLFEHTELLMLSLIGVHEYDDANAAIKNAEGVDEANKLRMQLFVLGSKEKHKKDEQTKAALHLKNQYGEIIDYRNLCYVYKRYGEWKRIPPVAKKWFELSNSHLAIECLAEAYYFVNRSKFVKTIKRIEETHGLNDRLTRYKAMDLFQNGELSEAVKLIRQVGLDNENENLTLQLAQYELAQGNARESIRVLESFVDAHPSAVEPTILLANLLLDKDKPQAFEHMAKLRDLHPTNMRVQMVAADIAIHADREEIGFSWFANVMKHDESEQFMRTVTIDEMIAMIEQSKKRSAQIDGFYIETGVPVHFHADEVKYSIGYQAFLNWQENFATKTFWQFGGKRYINDNEVFSQRKIAMDYTALLSTYCLGLFPQLKSMFDTVYISPRFFPCVSEEIRDLGRIQQSIYDGHQKLLRYLDNHLDSIQRIYAETCYAEVEGIQSHDLLLYHTASKHGANVVNDDYITESITNGQVLPEMEEIRIYTSEVLAFLSKKGFSLNADSNKPVRLDVVDALVTKKPRLLVDHILMETLQSQIDLTDLADTADFLVLDTDLASIRTECENMERQLRGKEWLQKYADEVNNLKNEGLIEFCPMCSQNDDRQGKYISTLLDTIEGGRQLDVPLWIDDRFAGSYYNTTPGTMVGIVDVLQIMKAKSYLNDNEWRSKYSSLISHDIVFLILPWEYVLFYLESASVEQYRVVKENAGLARCRKYLFSILHPESAIYKGSVRDTRLPEVVVYLQSLFDNALKCLSKIWNHSRKDYEWKVAASDWVLDHYASFFCDVDKESVNIDDDMLALKHAVLIGNALCVIREHRTLYMEWLFLQFGYYWRMNPDSINATASALAKIIVAGECDTLIEQLIIQELQSCVPQPFFALVLENPYCKEKWGHTYEYKRVEFEVEEDNDEVHRIGEEESIDVSVDPNEILLQNPDEWRQAVKVVLNKREDASLNDLIVFLNEHVQIYGSKYLSEEFRNFIHKMSWIAPEASRNDVVRLRRRIP